MSDPNRVRCACQRCTIRGLMWPAVIITVGLLLLLSELRGGFFDFSNTYPVILLVIGAVSLASALAPMNGHVVAVPPPVVPPIAPAGTPGTNPAWQPPQNRQGQ
jgi:ABC-type Fe3+ transport system permease subunit